MCQRHWPAVRLTTEAVPAVMASTWEWISCFDSSILFCIHTFEAWREETKCKSVITVIPQRRHTGLKTQTPETNFIKWHFFHFQCMYVHCTVPCPAPEEAGCRLPRDLSGPSAQLAYWCWWFPSEPAVLNSAHTERPAGSLCTEFSLGYLKKKKTLPSENNRLHLWILLFMYTGTVGWNGWQALHYEWGERRNGQKWHREPFCCSHQRRHVSTVHLTHRDLLLRGRHGAHAEGLGADGARADHPWQRHWTVLRPAHAVKLLLEDCGPAGRHTKRQ